MAVVYQTRSITNNDEVRLCECDHRPGYTHLVMVNGAIKCYADNIRDAYRMYNELAR